MTKKNIKIHRPRFVFFDSCQAKKRYKTEREAMNVAEIQMLQNVGLELSVYKCDICGFWHLTRRVIK